MIDIAFVNAVMPHCPDAPRWADLLSQVLPEYEINTPIRVASFVAQTSHESLDYSVLSENLNYGAPGLLATFPKHFDLPTATLYARQPEKIANRVYANRLGNDDEASGDGYKFRGRGLLQVTGHDNYYQCSQFLFSDDRLVEQPELLLIPENALRSACWFWSVHNINPVSDTGNVQTVTRIVNGGLNSLDDRVTRYNKAINYLNNA